jgi:Rrf2 family protein
MVHLAGKTDQPVLSRDIARELSIPEHFLAKILQDLSKSRLLLSFKGRGGGFRLARPAGEIRLLEVIQAIDGPQFGQGCLLGLPQCSDETPCPLHYQWAQIKTRIMRALGDTTIDHVLTGSLPADLA